MPTPPSTANYFVGGVTVILGGFDLGNIVSFEMDPSDIDVLEHFTARSGARKVDLQRVTQKSLVFTAEVDELMGSPALMRLFTMGGGSGNTVTVLTNPLAETNCVITWLTESGTVATYSHSRVTARPSGSMDEGEFDDWATGEIEIEALDDGAGSLGTITYT